jgi:hypothetical protein
LVAFCSRRWVFGDSHDLEQKAAVGVTTRGEFTSLAKGVTPEAGLEARDRPDPANQDRSTVRRITSPQPLAQQYGLIGPIISY